METDLSNGLLATARALAVDSFGAEVVAAWREAGIEPILLKGATLAGWLYADGVRPYGDTDLLVAPSQVMKAAEILGRLGYVPVDHHVSLHAHPWIRAGDGAEIDLHVRLYGLHYPPERAWRELQSCVEMVELAGVPVRALSEPARALQVTLHAAQHVDEAKPREDLRRALRTLPESGWRQSEQIADRVGGLKTMSRGLALDQAGRELIGRLPMVQAATIAGPAHAPLAIGVARFAEADGLGAKLRVVVDAVRRPAEDLDLMAGGGTARRFGEPAARVWHVLTLLVQVPETLWTLRRERRRRAGRDRA